MTRGWLVPPSLPSPPPHTPTATLARTNPSPSLLDYFRSNPLPRTASQRARTLSSARRMRRYQDTLDSIPTASTDTPPRPSSPADTPIAAPQDLAPQPTRKRKRLQRTSIATNRRRQIVRHAYIADRAQSAARTAVRTGNQDPDDAHEGDQAGGLNNKTGEGID